MYAALRRAGGALLAAGTLLGPLGSASAPAQTRPYNPLVRQTAAEQEVVADAKASSASANPQSSSAAPKPFRPTASPGWRAMQAPGSRRPPIMVPPHVARQPQQPYYDERPMENLPPPAEPRPTRPPAAPPHIGPTPMNNGPIFTEGEPYEGPHPAGCCDGQCGDACNCGDCDCDGYDACGCGRCDDCCGPHFTLLRHIWPRNISAFGGVHGFKGPVDQGVNGNFGFHEGLNFAGPIAPGCGIGYQVGAQVYHSNFSGDQVVQPTTDSREQLFLTAGLFRKAVLCCDWQGGVVFDLLHDYYYADMTLTQIRGELSLVGPYRHELGMWFTAGLEDDSLTVNGQVERWEPTDLFAFFYRKNLDCGVACRAWGGFTGRADGLIGGDLLLPFSDAWALQANFNYLLPEEGGSFEGASEESWHLALNLVWYPSGKARCTQSRPLFNVADNGTFMVDRRNR